MQPRALLPVGGGGRRGGSHHRVPEARIDLRPGDRRAADAAGDRPRRDLSREGRGGSRPDRRGGLMATETLEKTISLEIRDLHAAVEGKEILKGIDLTVRQGEVHALMGPNGSGKSTLASVLMGRPSYTVTNGEIRFKGQDIRALKPDQRAQLGVFLAFQHPTENPRGSGVNFLR